MPGITSGLTPEQKKELVQLGGELGIDVQADVGVLMLTLLRGLSEGRARLSDLEARVSAIEAKPAARQPSVPPNPKHRGR